MPPKVRELKSMLRKGGFAARAGKGSHTIWTHARLAGQSVVLSGQDGDDAKAYQERQVRQAIRDAGGER